MNAADETEAKALALDLNRRAEGNAIYANNQKDLPAGRHTSWRLSPEPYALPAVRLEAIRALGDHLLAFIGAGNKLYFESVKGRQPAWVHAYLDQGKPGALIEFQRMNRFKNLVPRVIRPDLIIDEDGNLAACELDSIPGGIGMTGSMGEDYADLGYGVVGGREGLITGFAAMIRDVAGRPDPVLAMVVSEESSDYLLEQQWVGARLNASGLPTTVVRPGDLRYDGEAFHAPFLDGVERKIDVVYRFFELFDLKNIPKAELVQYATKKGQVVVTPPYKAFLEEKMTFALYHHPSLRPFWKAELPAETLAVLDTLLPRTWIVDPAPLPPHAAIPGLAVEGVPLTEWLDLAKATKRDRAFVLKPSGFSNLAWGSHGVAFGHDLSTPDWEAALANAKVQFPTTPYILQEFRKPERTEVRYYHFGRDQIVKMEGRARLCPYYYIIDGKTELGGILATICPLDKLAIHGMTDAVMVPVAEA
jgi:hypothetical protein